MIIEMFIKANLSKEKDNVIPVKMGEVHIGEALKVISEVGENIYRVEARIFPDKEEIVMKAMQKEIDGYAKKT